MSSKIVGCEGPVLRLLLGRVGRHDRRRADRRGRTARRDSRRARQPVDRRGRRLGPNACSRAGIGATKFYVRGEDGELTRITTTWHVRRWATEAHAHRTLREIYALIDGSRLSATGKDRAKSLFARLGDVEGTIHGTPVDKVHLHEVGALDSIVDIVSTVHALEPLGADRIVASPLNVGSGTIRSAHGLYPVPAPATVRLLEGVPIYSGTQRAEMVTPTGALLITAYATEFGGIPAMSDQRRSAMAPARAISKTRRTYCAC